MFGTGAWLPDGSLQDEASWVFRDVVTGTPGSTTGILNVGDVVQVIHEFRIVGGVADSTSGTTVLGVGAFEVTNKSYTGDFYNVYSFGAVSASNSQYSVSSMLAGFTDASDLLGTAGTDPVFALLRRTDADMSINQGTGSLGLDGTQNDLGLNSSDPWTVEATASLDGVDDFMEWVQFSANNVNLNVAFYDANNAGVSFDGYSAKMALTFDQYSGSDPVGSFDQTTTNQAGTLVTADLVSTAQAPIFTTTAGTTASGFTGTYTNFDLQTLTTVPEPSSVVVLACIGFVGLARSKRKS